MTRLYFILSVAGWAWLLVVAVFLTVRLTVKRKPVRGFDVLEARTDASAARGGDGDGGGKGR